MGAGSWQFRPDCAFKRATEIAPNFLTRRGIGGLILDLDNTLTRWEDEEVASGITEWVRSLLEAGVRLVILSNGMHGKQARVSQALGLPIVIARLPKPFAQGFAEALRVLGLPKEKVAMVGDIVFTDIWGANRLRICTILVDPLSARDFPGTKVWRMLERMFGLRRPAEGAGAQ